MLSFLSVLLSCTGKENGKDDSRELPADGAPIEVVDGMVTFIVKSPVVMSGRTIRVNSQSYVVCRDEKSGREYVRVSVSAFGDYAGEYVPQNADMWCEPSTASKDIFLPHGQFHGTTSRDLLNMPMFARYRESTGNILKFCGPYASVKLSCRGEGRIASLALECTRGTLAGRFSYDPYKGEVTVSEKVRTAVLNCMRDGGAPMTDDFTIAVIPGEYKGLRLAVVSTDHRRCVINLGDVKLEAGDVKERELNWNPEDNFFYEGFDTFVWGGDVIGGSSAAAYSPDDAKPDAAVPMQRSGYEYAEIPVACTVAGAAYFSEYNSGTVTSVMPESYWQSRNMTDYAGVVRAQEYQGCIAVGTVSGHRGWLTTPPLNIPRFTKVKVEFDICPCHNSVDEIIFTLQNSGVITSFKVGGTEILKNIDIVERKSPGTNVLMPKSNIAIPVSATAVKKWTHVEAVVENASDNTRLKFMSSNTDSGMHTFYVDNICVSKDPDTYAGQTYRFIYWNILYGMATDSDSNYDNWVNWINGYSPDVCVWCEARSNSREGYYLPANYPALASRYGHPNCVGTGTYHMTGVSGAGTEGFPQEVTSRYPLRKIKDVTYSHKIKDESGSESNRISHGGGLVELNLDGRIIYVVPLHLIPRVNADRAAMDEYQENEIRTILDATVLNPEYASQKDWIMCGDFNSQSPGDRWYYEAKGSASAYRAHEYIRTHTDLIDVVQSRFEGMFITSIYSAGRIDYIYASPSVYKDIVRAGALLDSFSTSYKIENSPRSYAEYYPSDHRPVMIEIKK